MEAKDWVALAAGVGITAISGYALYRWFREKKSPGLAPAVLVPALTGVMLYSMSPAPTPMGALRAGGLIPPMVEAIT